MYNKSLSVTLVAFLLLGILFTGETHTFAKEVSKKQTKDELLEANDCYDHYTYGDKHYVVIKPTDLCLAIAYPDDEYL
jgi:hypothetical protein